MIDDVLMRNLDRRLKWLKVINTWYAERFMRRLDIIKNKVRDR